jgi:proline dehydrogenase
MLRQAILAASRSTRTRNLVEKAPVSKQVVHRFVPGATVDDAVRATKELIASGRTVTLDHLGEDTTDAAMAQKTVDAYLSLLTRLQDAGLTVGAKAEVSVKLSAVGQTIDEKLARDNATLICAAARNAGTTVTLDMEDHTTTDSTLGILRELRQDFPDTGAVVQAYLKRTEGDCRDLAVKGSRVRLCKGAYKEPASVAFQGKDDVDASYVRCLEVLMNGDGYPMVATHDPAMITAGKRLSKGRSKGSYEFQMLYGIRPTEQQKLADEGETMRVYVPYGDEWYGYFMRRLAERPANVAFFLRSLVSKK